MSVLRAFSQQLQNHRFWLLRNSSPVSRSVLPEAKISGALVAELVDAQDLKSCGQQCPCRFDPGPGHQPPREIGEVFLFIGGNKDKNRCLFIYLSH